MRSHGNLTHTSGPGPVAAQEDLGRDLVDSPAAGVCDNQVHRVLHSPAC